MRSPIASGLAYWSRMRLNPRAAARRIDTGFPAATQSGGCGWCAGGGSPPKSPQLPKRPRRGKTRSRQPRPRDHLNRFIEACLGFLLRDAETGEFVVPVALADPEIEPAAGEQIEGRRLFRQQPRVVPGEPHHP